MPEPYPFRVVSGPAWPGVRYFCTTRQGGISTGPWAQFNLGFNTAEALEITTANRQRLSQVIPSVPFWLTQVHGNTVADADAYSTLSPERPEADAAVTTARGRVLAVLTADCLPVVLSDAAASVVAVAHAGWRGLAGGVLENTLRAMADRAPAASLWRAWIGPGIGAQAFEVGDDVYQAFIGHDPQCARHFKPRSRTRPGKWLADLPGLAALRLANAGVSEIALSGRCTFSEPEHFYSYRREPVTGRMATVVWLDERPTVVSGSTQG